MPRPRTSIVVTGSELVRGDRTDRNGPYYAREALALGLEPARVTIVGDDPSELESALREAISAADLCLVSGGLGPTHDDRTVELLARVTGRELVLDEQLRAEIDTVARGHARRFGRPYEDFVPGIRKQAMLPAGAISVGIAGTAPGIVLSHDGAVVVVLPGPPAELRRLWPRVLETEPVRGVLARARRPERRVLKFFGVNESAVARAFEAAGGEGGGVDVTICARDFEVHVDLVVEPGAESRTRADEIADGLRAGVGRYLFTEDDRSVQELVLDLCRRRGLTLATAESCTGGLVAARLTTVPGSSDVFLGGVVAYSNEVKERELGVSPQTLARHGAVSAETAAEMTAGVRARLGADVGVAVTGIAGPGGGTADKPVGLVHLHASGPDADEAASFELPSDRETLRARATVAALHLVRRLLAPRA